MEEAERLAHSLVVLDVGHVIARGTAWELKEQIGGDVLEVRVKQPADLERARAILVDVAGTAPRVDIDQRLVTVPASGGTHFLIAVGRRFEQENLPLDDLGIRHPSLDDVFLSLTGVARSDGS